VSTWSARSVVVRSRTSFSLAVDGQSVRGDGGEESEYDCLSPSDIERFNRTLTVLIGIPTYLMSWLPINPAFKNRHKSPFFLLHGRDPRLPSVLDYDPPAHRWELPLDFDLASSLSQVWDLARSNVCEAQKAQKQAYNLKSGMSVFMKVIVSLSTCPRKRLPKPISLHDHFTDSFG
jgi:hypothetical protein